MKNAYKMQFGKYLKIQRLTQGFTQSKFSKTTEITIKALGSYEEGRALPPIPTFQKICSTLKTTPNKFLSEMKKIEMAQA